MKTLREIFGYTLGGVLFVGLLPFLMWLASLKPALWPVSIAQIIIAAVFIIIGLVLSVWTIIYMRHKGDGNPMDAFNHEIAPRTKHLMTDGPYKINRNPMLTGIFIYLIGICVWLWTWQSVVVFVAFVAIMSIQVISEEKRLLRDFGQEYEDYKNESEDIFNNHSTWKSRANSRNRKHPKPMCSNTSVFFVLLHQPRFWSVFPTTPSPHQLRIKAT